MLQTSPATEGPTLYLPHALAPDPATPPPGLPAADAPGAWEAALVGAWMLDQVWADLLRRLRGPLLGAGIVALVAGLVIAGLALGGQGTWAGPLALVWVGLVLLTLGALWLARPRPLELTRVWWAWETWGLEKGVVVWDTLDPGEGLGYPEPETPLAPLEAQAADAAEGGLDDAEVLMRLLKLNSALEGLRWKSWPGVFAAKPPAPAAEAEAPPPLPGAADELAALPVDIPPPELFPHMRVLVPRLDPEQVRAAAERLAGWPAYQTAAREVWRQINAHLQDLTPLLDGWDAAAGAAADSVAAATQALAAHRARATQLADEAVAALEADIAPDLDRVWQLHVEGGKLLSSYVARALEEERAAGYRAQDRAAAQVTAAERDLRRQESLLAEIGAGLRPLEAQWAEAGAAHQRLGADLQQAWREVRAQRPPAGDDPAYVAARAVDIRQAGTLVPQLAQETTRLIRQGEEFMAACAREERDLPAELPWPAWPARISMPLAVEADLTALNGVLRRLRAEPVRARARLDALRTLLGKTTLTLERALGAQEALAQAVSTASVEAAADPSAEPGRLAGLESQAAGLIRRLQPLLTDLQHWQRRLELTSVSYVELADSLAEALKGGRHGPPWQQGQRLQAEHVRLEADQAAAAGQYDAVRAALAAAQDEVERIHVSTENTLAHLTRMEQDLMARSEEFAGQEETACRRHVEQIRARHAAVLAALGERGDWLRALADFDRTGAAAKIHAVERLRERIQMRTALADGRIADTAEARSQAFWPLDSWPAGDMLYLLPVWLLRYRPFGRAGAPRVLAVTPGHVRAAARGRFRPAPGFVVDPLPGLAAHFGADLGDSAAAGPDLSAALEGENVLRPGGPVPAQWRDLAARGLVAPWLPRLI